MSRRSLLPVLVTAVIVLAALNLGIAAWSHRLPYALKLETIRSASDPNLLFVGNSLLDHHLDDAALVQAAAAQGRDFRPLNAALSASEPPEQRLLFDYATAGRPGIRTVVVGFYDFQLTTPTHTRVSDLTGNRMVGIDHRFPLGKVAAIYGFGPLARARLALLRSLPMAANRANVWKYVELLRRSMSDQGMPHAAVNSMGRVDDFAALEARSPEAFDNQARSFLANPNQFNPSYEVIFDKARSDRMNIVIVVMPMSPAHRQVFYSRPLWGQYCAALENLARSRGIRVIDMSNMFASEDDFADHLHMTPESARVFSIRLGQALAQSGSR